PARVHARRRSRHRCERPRLHGGAREARGPAHHGHLRRDRCWRRGMRVPGHARCGGLFRRRHSPKRRESRIARMPPRHRGRRAWRPAARSPGARGGRKAAARGAPPPRSGGGARTALRRMLRGACGAARDPGRGGEGAARGTFGNRHACQLTGPPPWCRDAWGSGGTHCLLRRARPWKAAGMGALLRVSRHVIVVAVLGCLVMFAAVTIFAAVAVVHAIVQMSRGGGAPLTEIATVTVHAFKILDLFLLGAILYIVALGLSALFLDADTALPAWFEVRELRDLKVVLSQSVVV